jgi:hypothetical protein
VTELYQYIITHPENILDFMTESEAYIKARQQQADDMLTECILYINTYFSSKTSSAFNSHKSNIK